jgi:hypothetical protein
VSGAPLRLIEDPDPRALPPGAEQFLAELGGPTAIRLTGADRRRCRAAVTLLHGNEPSGTRALHAWLRSGARPATDVLCVLGAVPAALRPPGFAHRSLPGARDLNRCFRPPFAGAEGALAAAVLALLRDAAPEAVIDLHNNSGHNPPYGVVTAVDPLRARLTSLFAHRLVHSDIRLGSLMEATAELCPTATIECGRGGDPAADETARAGLERYLACERLEHLPPPALSILERPVRVCVRGGIRVAFAAAPAADADLTLAADIDRHNFEIVPAGTTIGWLADPQRWPIEARGANGGTARASSSTPPPASSPPARRSPRS